MNKTTLLVAIAASTAVLAGCGSAEPAAVPVAPLSSPEASSAAPAVSQPAAPAPASTAAPGSAPASAPAGAATLPAPVSDLGAAVDADDQIGDGATVVVRIAQLTAGPGWVAIRTDDDSGNRLVGSAPLAPGQTGPITVTLTEPVPATGDDGGDLTAVLHLDDGDGAFDETLDPRILDEDGDDRDHDRDDHDDHDRDDHDRDDIEDNDFDYRIG